MYPDIEQQSRQALSPSGSTDTLLEAMFDSVPGLLYLYTEDGRLIRWNKQHEMMTGYSSEELMNFRAEDWFDEDDRLILAREFQKVFVESIGQVEMKVVFKDGVKVPFYLTGVRVEIEGKPHLVGIGLDISELKRQEEALRRSQELFEQAEIIGQIGTWRHDVTKNERFWSAGVYRILGLAAGNPLNDDEIIEIVHPDDRAFVVASRKASLQSGGHDIEFRIVVAGKTKWVRVKASVFSSPTGEPFETVGVIFDITDKKKAEDEKKRVLEEIKRLKELLEAKNNHLKKESHGLQESDEIIGESDAMRYVLFRAKQVAMTDSTVLLLGETGTGKGVLARFIHRQSPRKDKPFVTVNCAGLPANLIESELFGREKGAFTSADAKQIGRFEMANGGTILLDELGELQVDLQLKLLRVIEDGEFERLGSSRSTKVDVRIIAATNRNLRQEIDEGRFREDLFYRLNVFPITIPPLRQHRDDIPLLIHFFLQKFNKRFGRSITEIPEEVMRSLRAHSWPGNIRELMGIIERSVIISSGSILHFTEEVVSGKRNEVFQPQTQNKKALSNVEKDHIHAILMETGWKVEGPSGAASLLGLNPSTLRARMKKLNIRRPTPSKSNPFLS